MAFSLITRVKAQDTDSNIRHVDREMLYLNWCEWEYWCMCQACKTKKTYISKNEHKKVVCANNSITCLLLIKDLTLNRLIRNKARRAFVILWSPTNDSKLIWISGIEVNPNHIWSEGGGFMHTRIVPQIEETLIPNKRGTFNRWKIVMSGNRLVLIWHNIISATVASRHAHKMSISYGDNLFDWNIGWINKLTNWTCQ